MSGSHCFVCKLQVDAEHCASLSSETLCSGKPIYKLIEAISHDVTEADSSALCQECYDKFERFDLLFTNAMELKDELLQLLNQTKFEFEMVSSVEDFANDDDVKQWPIIASETKSEGKEEVLEEENIELEPVKQKEAKKSNKKSTTTKPFLKCRICDKYFRTRSHLTSHLNIHSTDRNFQCKFCNKCLKSQACLKYHENTHTERPKLICDGCGSCYVCPKSFTLHYFKNHTTRKDYLCSSCPNAYANLRDLTMHLVVHSGIKKHACNVCEAKFFYSKTLKRHLRTHGPKAGFTCPFCPQQFREKYQVNAHVKRIHDRSNFVEQRRDFFCSICQKKFDRKLKLREHLRTIHEVASDTETVNF